MDMPPDNLFLLWPCMFLGPTEHKAAYWTDCPPVLAMIMQGGCYKIQVDDRSWAGHSQGVVSLHGAYDKFVGEGEGAGCICRSPSVSRIRC